MEQFANLLVIVCLAIVKISVLQFYKRIFQYSSLVKGANIIIIIILLWVLLFVVVSHWLPRGGYKDSHAFEVEPFQQRKSI